jgi:hypothetical protein
MKTSSDPEFRHGLTSESAQLIGCGATDFDYASIDRALAPATPDSAPPTADDEQVLEGFSAALGLLVDLLIPPGGDTPPPSTLGVRLIALLQLVRPEALDGKSMTEIARDGGITRAALSKMLVAYSDTFQFWARHQRSLKARKTYADVQRTLRERQRRLRSAALLALESRAA